MKYIILGNGFIANKFLKKLGQQAIIIPQKIEYFSDIETILFDFPADVVINAIGKTGRPNVDWCEDHKDETLFANVTIPVMIAECCKNRNQYWAHIGSGCIYEGNNKGKGFTETDPPNFDGSFYSRTKSHCESLLNTFDNVLQLRLRIPVDNEPSVKNLIDKLKKYDKVADVTNSMSIVPDFINASVTLIEKRKTGTYNVTNPGALSLIDVMNMYKEIVDPSFTFEIMTGNNLDNITKAKRSNCVLNVDKLLNEGIEMPPIEESIKKCLEKYKTHL